MTSLTRNTIDLHTHTARSDGVLTPVALYEAMRAWGSTLVAITDHDTLAGATELSAAGCGTPGTSGPRIIVGVEINTMVDESIEQAGGHEEMLGELHILGLGVDPLDERFRARLEQQRNARAIRLELTLARLREIGLPVDDHLPVVAGGIDALGRPHVARALVSAGHALSVQDAFDRFLVPGAPGYVRRQGMGPRAAIDAIRAAGGIASLAHAPWVLEAPTVMSELVRWGLGALEVHYHGWFDERVDAMAAVADGHGLLRTGGSDYHGDTGTYAAAQADVRVPSEVGERLLDALGM